MITEKTKSYDNRESEIRIIREVIGEALGIDFEHPDDTLEPGCGLERDENFENALANELYHRFSRLTKQEKEMLLFYYEAADGNKNTARDTMDRFGVTRKEMYDVINRVLGCRCRYSNFKLLKKQIQKI